jgi:hypothetical protein
MSAIPKSRLYGPAGFHLEFICVAQHIAGHRRSGGRRDMNGSGLPNVVAPFAKTAAAAARP